MNLEGTRKSEAMDIFPYIAQTIQMQIKKDM